MNLKVIALGHCLGGRGRLSVLGLVTLWVRLVFDRHLCFVFFNNPIIPYLDLLLDNGVSAHGNFDLSVNFIRLAKHTLFGGHRFISYKARGLRFAVNNGGASPRFQLRFLSLYSQAQLFCT